MLEGAPAVDPVRVRRARYARWVKAGKRAGYTCLLAAMVLGLTGLVVGLSDDVATVTVVLLVAGSIVLAPAIVFGYAVSAAERDDVARGL
jgi:hypothetical protein